MDEKTKKLLQEKFLPKKNKEKRKPFNIRLTEEKYAEVKKYVELLDSTLQDFGELAISRFIEDIEKTREEIEKS